MIVVGPLEKRAMESVEKFAVVQREYMLRAMVQFPVKRLRHTI